MDREQPPIERIELEIDLEAVPDAAARARQALKVFADDLRSDQYADLLVVVTELVTNSIKYGPGGMLALTVTLGADGRIRGDVVDAGEGGVAIRTGGPIDGGIGLRIVDALTRSWGVYPRSSHVWFELAAAGLGAAAGASRPPRDRGKR